MCQHRRVKPKVNIPRRGVIALIAVPLVALALAMSGCSAKAAGNNRVVVSAIAADGSAGAATPAPGMLAPLPAGWPATLGIGLASGQGDAATLALQLVAAVSLPVPRGRCKYRPGLDDME